MCWSHKYRLKQPDPFSNIKSPKSGEMKQILAIAGFALLVCACGGGTKKVEDKPLNAAPSFAGDSAMAYIKAQCDFGPRVPGSEAHRLCGDYIAAQFAGYGLAVTEQKALLTAWNGDRLPMRNIIASLHPEAKSRLLVTAHWDSRPWADNDPDPANHHTAVMGANDGASGVAVMLEMARTLTSFDGECGVARGDIGIDFICFDCEDYGRAQWSDVEDESGETWALGAQHWAQTPHTIPYRAAWGVNLDMVGGREARFLREGFSRHYAPNTVQKVWDLAARLALTKYFPAQDGGYTTDDHVPVNQRLSIPTIDIVPHYADNERSAFGDTWHTVNDTPENIEKSVLQAVGTLMNTLVCNPF